MILNMERRFEVQSAEARDRTTAGDADRIAVLVSVSRNGHRDAFGLLYEEFSGRIYRYVYARTGKVELAEDLTQEVFLKALSYVRNRGIRLEHFSTAVFDFLHHYRPEQNVVRRAVGKKGRGFYFIGHHEIMIPLLAAGLAAGR